RYVRLDPVYSRGGLFEPAGGDAPQLPVRLEPGEALTFDFGKMVIGHPVVELESEAGAAVVLRSGELLEEGAPFDRARQWAHRRVCRGGVDRAEGFEIAGMRYLTVAAEGQLTIRSVGLRE